MKQSELLRGSDPGFLDQAFHRVRWLGSFRDPGVHFSEIELCITFFHSRIIAAEDFKETAIALKALVSSYYTIHAMPVGTFLTETKNNSHVKILMEFEGRESGSEMHEIKPYFRDFQDCCSMAAGI
jgi:hypothetical protein